MLFYIIIFSLLGIVAGTTVTIVACNALALERMREVEQHWQGLCAKNHAEWKTFHRNELDRWQEKSAYLIKKAAYDATMAEYKRIMGQKEKPPEPSN